MHQLLHFLLDQLNPVFFCQITFCQSDDTRFYFQQTQDFEVFTSLGLDRVICCHDQQSEVGSSSARQHVANEPFVAGYVDNSQAVVADVQFREPKIDRDPATLLVWKSVGINPG